MIQLKMPTWFDSIRGISTFLLVATYCVIMLVVCRTGCQLLLEGKDIGEKIIVFALGNLTGTAIGAVVAYFFKERTPQEGSTQK